MSNKAEFENTELRLDKFLCDGTGISRAQARRFIQKGTVSVNGTVQRKADARVLSTDTVCVNGKAVEAQRFVYIMLNKPRGVVSASKDGRDVTVVDLLKGEYKRRRLFPAGRLDKDSRGFILLTDDGAFAHDILAPKKHVSKGYVVKTDSPLSEQLIYEFEKGVVLADGSVMKPAKLSILQPDTAYIELSQGVYHQIKRMLGVYGIGVTDLKRVSMGTLMLDETLKEGEWRELTYDELEKIKGKA